MSIRLGKEMSSRLSCLFSGLFLLIVNIVLCPSLSFAQSCSITSMQSDKEIRACQIEDMRSLINHARSACAVGPISAYPFSDDPIIPSATAISIRHLDEMKDAISEIATNCGPIRPTPTFTTVNAGDIISVRDFVGLYNIFVSTSFCGDSICDLGIEDITTCPVDCGGTAQFYCNGIGGCYAAVTCPSGKTCYTDLQECLDHVSTDCQPCTPQCLEQGDRYICQSWSDGCGGLCFGTKNPSCECAGSTCSDTQCIDVCGGICQGTLTSDCSCASKTCQNSTCVDACGGTCVGTMPPDCSCASDTCPGQTCADDCGGTCAGTKAPDCSCASSTCTGLSCTDSCGNSCPGAMSPDCSCASSTCPGQTCSDGCGGTCAGSATPDCSCAGITCWDDVCAGSCSEMCVGSRRLLLSCQLELQSDCSATPSISLYACGNNPEIAGYYYYRCNGTCTPTAANLVSGLIPNCTPFVDTSVVPGQTYSYSARFYTTGGNFSTVFSATKTHTLNVPSCACAALTCPGQTCSDGCGGTCSGTRPPNCSSCAPNTCTGQDCTDSCGNICAGTKTPDCSCAASTCPGQTCSDGCGGTCMGTKPPDCSCAANTCTGLDCTDSCGNVCAGTKVPDCSCASGTCVGQTCSDGCGGTCPGTKVPTCACSPNTCPGQSCTDSCGNVDACPGTMPPDCSCAANTCPDQSCTDACGASCPGTKPPDCACAAGTCIGQTCSDSCGNSCSGTLAPDCTCAMFTCTGETCSDGCGGTCPGTDDCEPPIFPPIECKKWTCASGSGFCLQDHTETCSCPAGKKPVCNSAPPVACGSGACPDTACGCID